MIIRPVAEILKELKERYDRDPRGWRVLTGKDVKGRYDMFISHGSLVWQIKMEKVRPYQYVGFGTKVGKADSSAISKFEEGYPVLFEMASPQNDGSLIVARGVERHSSHSTSDLKMLISNRQKELEFRLSEELSKLLFRCYPEMLMYT